MILAGDIGGTKTVLGLYRSRSGKVKLIEEALFESQKYSTFEKILQIFLKGKSLRNIKVMCLGIAGPVRNGESKTTNLPWYVSEKKLSKRFGIKKVYLLNDLEASAFGMLYLKPEEMVSLNRPKEKSPTGNIAVIAAGTGLGEAMLYWTGRSYLPVASEGGHSDFAPQNEMEVNLFRYLKSKFGHVSYERVLSGPGIYNIYQFLRDTRVLIEPAWLRSRIRSSPDPSATITQMGMARQHGLCVRTLDLFTAIYGAEAGNLALKVLGLGGVYIGGGIAPKILKKLKSGIFVKAFYDKGRYCPMLKEIPVKVALNTRTPLIGVAHYALQI